MQHSSPNWRVAVGDSIDETSISDKTRLALNEALKMFGEFSRIAAWKQLETDFHITRTGSRTVSRSEIEFALQKIFGRGAEIVMKSFDNELAKVA